MKVKIEDYYSINIHTWSLRISLDELRKKVIDKILDGNR